MQENGRRIVEEGLLTEGRKMVVVAREGMKEKMNAKEDGSEEIIYEKKEEIRD